MGGKKKKPIGSNPDISDKKLEVGQKPQVKIKPQEFRDKRMVMAIMLFAFSFLLYANTLKNGFALDDMEVITQNGYVTKGISGIPEILSTPHLRGFIISPNETYRPLSLVFFAVEYQIWGASPIPGHFFNVLFFGFCVVLLFIFLDNLFNHNKTIAVFIAALLFAAHPVHTEVVDNIKSFDELLCFFFAFLALNLFIKYMREGKSWFLISAGAMMFLSLISKETVISFIFIVPVVFFIYQNESKKRAFAISAATLLSAILFLAVRALVLKLNHNTTSELNVIQNALAGAPDKLTKVATALLVLGFYFKLMFVPYPLISDYTMNSIPYTHFTDWRVWLTIVVYGLMAGTAFYRLRKFPKDPWAFGILFFIVTIALFSNFFFLIGSEMSERFTFFASEGICLLVALALDKWVIRSQVFNMKGLVKIKVWAVLIPVLFVFSSITLGRNEEWKDSDVLHECDLKKAPQNSHLNFCVGTEYISSKYESETDPITKQKLLSTGIGYLKKSLEIDPFYWSAHTEIGNAFFLNHQYDSAEIHDKIALKLNPGDIYTMNNMAGLYFVKKNFGSALTMSKEIIKQNPAFGKGYSNAGLCYFNLRKFDSGIYYLKMAISIDPDFAGQYENLALIYKQTGQIDSARKYEAIAKMVKH